MMSDHNLYSNVKVNVLFANYTNRKFLKYKHKDETCTSQTCLLHSFYVLFYHVYPLSQFLTSECVL